MNTTCTACASGATCIKSMTPAQINDLQVEMLHAAIKPPPPKALAQRIVEFCADEERSYWEIMAEFDDCKGLVKTLIAAVSARDLIRRQEPSGTYFKAKAAR
jgi:hypothetical protein